MRHLVKGRHLGRKPPHRIALMRNLACQLVAHERIVTTVAKAKELRGYVERLITVAKRANADAKGKDEKAAAVTMLHARRQILSKLGGKKFVPIKDEEINVVGKIMSELGVRYADRPGGYTRVIKRAHYRIGDAAPTAFIELMPAAETAAPPPKAPKKKSDKKPE
jgi:large subunit ribosomal protein L17